jgi:uncharacterized membrane protein
MVNRAKSLWLNLSQSLGFVPGVIVLVFALLGVALVEIDGHVDLNGVEFVFQGDGSAARTVLSVIAGSLITVAGLTFSITMVVLQLASSQFSPRILRTFFADRVTQVTIGTYVGTFVYSILVLRAVGAFGDTGFVPRLSVTLASLLGIAAVVLLVVFLQHVSQMVQVSHVTSTIAHAALARMEILYPERFGEPVEDAHADALRESWRAQPAGRLLPERPGYVQRVGVDDLVGRLGHEVERLAVLVCPGDFVSVETAIIETWPPVAAERCRGELLAAIAVSSERDLSQDVDFALRQLTDVALKAISPSINDPMTAVTCIGYLRSILVRLAERADPPAVRRFPDHDLTVIVRRRAFAEHLEGLLQINRYVQGDAWVAGAVLDALHACAQAALDCGAADRARAALEVAATVAEQAGAQAGNERDRERIQRLDTRTQALRATAGGA